MKIAICDGNTEERDKTLAFIQSIKETNPQWAISVITFTDGRSLLEGVEAGLAVDLYLIDTFVRTHNGIALGKVIRELAPQASIAYTARVRDYAADAFETQAMDYLLKPIALKRIKSLLARVEARIGIARLTFDFKIKGGLAHVLIDNVSYAENVARHVELHMGDGTLHQGIINREPFDTVVKKLLEQPNFIKIHQSYIVNMDKVVAIAGGRLTLEDGTTLPISRSRLSDVRIQWQTHCEKKK